MTALNLREEEEVEEYTFTTVHTSE